MAIPRNTNLLSSGDWSTPYPHDARTFTYVASGAADDDAIVTIVYKRGGTSGTAVATLTLAYVGATNNIASMALTIP